MDPPPQPGIDGGWAHGPAEAWAFATRLAHEDSDLARRMAMLVVDNAAELGIKTYLHLHPKQRGGPRYSPDRDPSFHTLVDTLFKWFSEADLPIGRSELLWMHDVRNVLHHQGNGLSPDRRHLSRYLGAVERLLAFLFTDAPLNVALEEVDTTALEHSPPPTPPPVLVELDEMVDRLRRRRAEMPDGASLHVIVPADLFDLVQRVDDYLMDTAPDWTSEQHEAAADNWLWDVDGLPPTYHDLVGELINLRTLLVMSWL